MSIWGQEKNMVLKLPPEIQEIIENYGRSLEYIKDRKRLFSQCMHWIKNNYCEGCGNTFKKNEQMYYICRYNQGKYCRNCSNNVHYCINCERIICLTHLTKCVVCESQKCIDCNYVSCPTCENFN